MRLARTDIGGLLVELDRDPTLDLQAPLARALHDPSLELAYWLPDQDTWADQDGRPIALPGPDQRRSIRLIYRNQRTDRRAVLRPGPGRRGGAAGRRLGRRRHRSGERPAAGRSSGPSCRSCSRRGCEPWKPAVGSGSDSNGTCTMAPSNGWSASPSSWVPSRAGWPPIPSSSSAWRRTREEVSASLDQLRDIARGIYPAVLSGHGLAVALESLTAGAAVPVSLHVGLTERLPEPVEVAAYYIVSEALANIGKHAHADTATVRVDREADLLVVEVIDDGIGGASIYGGSGLRGLRDRAEVLGGQVLIRTRPAAAAPSERRSHAHSDRRRQHARPRRSDPHPAGGRPGRGGRVRQRRRPAARGAPDAAGPGHRGHPATADARRRGNPGRHPHPRAPSGGRCPGAVPVRRARPGHAAARRSPPRGSAICSRTGSATSTSSSAPSTAWPTAAPPSIRRSSAP